MRPTDGDQAADPAAAEATRRVRVKNPTGVHLRLAAAIVRSTQFLRADIQLEHQGAMANARSVLSIATLGVGYEAELTIHATGIDAAEAVHALSRIIERDFDSDHLTAGESTVQKPSQTRSPRASNIRE